MRLRRSAPYLLALGLAAATLVTPAHAGVKLCNLLKDDSGDGQWVVPGVKSNTYDIVTGDVASGKKTVVAVLRIGSTNFTDSTDVGRALGVQWQFNMDVAGVQYRFYAKLGSGTDSTVDGFVSVANADIASALYKFQVVGNTFVWTVQRSAFPQLKKPKQVFSKFRGDSKALSITADTANTLTSKYPDMAASCVKAS